MELICLYICVQTPPKGKSLRPPNFCGGFWGPGGGGGLSLQLVLFSKLVPLELLGQLFVVFFSFVGEGRGETTGVMSEYYEPHLCKYTLTVVSKTVPKPHILQLLLNLCSAKSHCYMHSKLYKRSFQ